MEKTDIRVQFTRKVLRESLVELMKEKSILNISIREICEKAGVSRSTFYTYYKDQYELLEQMEEETFIRKVWFNTPRLAAAQVRQSLQRFGIKPDDIINFLAERTSAPTNTTLKIPHGLPCGGSLNWTGLSKNTTHRAQCLRQGN